MTSPKTNSNFRLLDLVKLLGLLFILVVGGSYFVINAGSPYPPTAARNYRSIVQATVDYHQHVGVYPDSLETLRPEYCTYPDVWRIYYSNTRWGFPGYVDSVDKWPSTSNNTNEEVYISFGGGRNSQPVKYHFESSEDPPETGWSGLRFHYFSSDPCFDPVVPTLDPVSEDEAFEIQRRHHNQSIRNRPDDRWR